MRLHIEPVVPQPPQGWELVSLIISRDYCVARWRSIPDDWRRHTVPLPHRPGDTLHGGVVERVEAKRTIEITLLHGQALGMPQMRGEAVKAGIIGWDVSVDDWDNYTSLENYVRYVWPKLHPDHPWTPDLWTWLYWLRED